ncbi:MAG: GTP 3',8-cyclase MoaA [Acidobacteria bacterium]|nr:GTP 3',8-cyclase MoaA [Acidobacteriota bacterium]
MILIPAMIKDTLDRPLKNLRISVTDRCNIRCQYCMPELEYVWLPREEILRFEEIDQLVDIFGDLGVDKVRLTGGEPLLRRNLPTLVEKLAAKPFLRDLALTTNGVLLAEHAQTLKDAGLHRVTVSLDTLRPERFKSFTRFDYLARVREGIAAAGRAGFDHLKLDTVVVRGVNEDEVVALIEYSKTVDAEVRFIEYMDVGGATGWSMDKVYSRQNILDEVGRHYGRVDPVVEVSSAPADRFMLPDGWTFGIISSTTAPFCRTCDRSRLTADGMWYLCLYALNGTNLREALRSGASADELRTLISKGWQVRADRGAEMRVELRQRDPLVSRETLRTDPHLEMHTRGG